MALRKDVFISATTHDLGSYRQVVKEALLTLGAHPIEETNFPTDHRQLTEMLARLLDPCDAVIHLAGFCYGDEPAPEPGVPRRSYSHWEYHRAIGGKCRKPTYVFLATEKPEFTALAELDSEKQHLQHAHREFLQRAGHIYYFFSDEKELREKILGIRELREFLQPRRRRIPFPPLREKFVGRIAILQTLERELTAGHATLLSQPAALHAEGGIGKTALAVELGWRLFEAGRFPFVFFLDASSPESLANDFAALCDAGALDLPEREAREQAIRRDAVLRWLRTPGHAERTLFLLDNADSEETREAVRALLPELLGSAILITSRSEIAAAVRTHRLDLFTPDEAREFLLTRLDPALLPNAPLHRVAEALGHLPLALDLAASYLKETRQSLTEWLEEWDAQPAQTLEHYNPADVAYRQDGLGIPIPLARVWDKSVARLSRSARELLDILAWFAPHPATLPLEPFKSQEIWKKMRPDLIELARASLIQWPQGTDAISVHRILQTVTRHRMKQDEKGTNLKVAVRWLNDICPSPEWSIPGWHLWEHLTPHLRAIWGHVRGTPAELEAACAIHHFGNWLRNRAEYAEAEPLLWQTLAVFEKCLGSDDPNVARCLNNLAGLLEDTNRLVEAEVLYREALDIDEANSMLGLPHHTESLHNFASVLHGTNRMTEAEALLRRSLITAEETFGPEDVRVAMGLNNLGELLRETNRLDEAEPLYRRALAIYEKTWGPAHPEIAISLNNLALLLRASHRLTEAETLYRRALVIDESCLGCEHPNVAIRLNNLASLLQDTDRLPEAEALYRRALMIQEKTLGPAHPNLAIGLNNLATLLRSTHRFAEAERVSRRMLSIYIKDITRTRQESPNAEIAFRNYRSLLMAMGASRDQAEERIMRLIAQVQQELAEQERKADG